MDQNFLALLFGTFLAETVKNAAKGSANWIGDNGNSLFYNEITQLNLNESATAEEITEQLEAKPEMIKVIEEKIKNSSDDVKELFEQKKVESENNSKYVNNIKADKIENVFNQPSGTFTFTHNKE